ncbi:MAG: methyl-accepting chemotaxis protein [Pseudobdellovibrionaceae bacterium]
MTKKLSLSTKLISMFALSSILLLVVGLIGTYSVKKVSEEYSHIAEINMPNSVLILEMRLAMNDSLRTLLQLSIPGNGPDEIERLSKNIKKFSDEYRETDKKYQAVEFAPGEDAVYNKANEAYKIVQNHIDANLSLAASPSPADRAAFADNFRGDFSKARTAYYAASNELLNFHDNEAKKWTEKAKNTGVQLSWLAMTVVICGFILSLAIGIIFARTLSRQLTKMSESLFQGSTEVNSAASEIATSSESLSSSSSEQAAAVQETSSAIEELTAMVGRNSDNAERSKEKAMVSQEVAQKGKSVVTEMMAAIAEINESNSNIMKAVEESNRSISEITQVITDIETKTTVIKDIVFQTKLLSFNASVEAARAGEHGKGFSVVAEEVGNLAQMSGNAAQEISGTLEESIKKVNQIVSDTKQRVESLIEAGKEKVERGHAIAGECEKILDQIVNEVTDVGSMVVEISNASKEQSHGIQEITKAMSQMDTVTHQNAAVSQTAASASVELASQSESLSLLVTQLKQIVEGSGGSNPSTPSVVSTNPTSLSHSNEETKILPIKSKKKNNLGVPSYDDVKVKGAR